MVLELIAGAALKAVIGELLKAVWHAKENASSFQSTLTDLELTLKAIIPRLDQISNLNKKVDHQRQQMEDLVAIINNGRELVLKCSEISSLNLIRRVQYSNELHDLDKSLLRYFITILPLDHYHYRNDLEMLVMAKELHTIHVGDDKKDGGTGNQSESSKANKDSGGGVNEIEKLYQDYKNKQAVKLQDDSRVGAAKKSNQKKEAINQSRKINDNKSGKKLFLLKGCPYEFHVEDILSRIQLLGKGTYGISYKCDLKFGQLMVKRLTLEMKIGEEDFKTRIEELGKVGQSPNILPPFGGYFSKFEKFLIYDYVPAGSLHSLLHGTKRYPKTPVVLDWNSTLKISLGVARGINHLHSVKFVHGNIKSSNVLLAQDLDGCISDYGLAPIMKFPTTTSQYLGYHAPEFIKSQEATIKSDVYSFGAMLLEILTGKPPDDVNFPRRVCSKVQEEGASSIFSFELLKYDCEEEMRQMLQIAMQCVEEEPKRRSEMNDVTMMIENILQKRALLAQANDAKLKGIKLFKDGLYLEALSQYELALQVVPDEMPSSSDLRCTCYVNRGKCFLKLGKYEDTITECNKALELNPDYLRALIKRGEANEKLQNFAWGIADMETSIWKLDPTDVKSKKTKKGLVAAEVKRLQKILECDNKSGKKLFLLKGYLYEFHVEDILSCIQLLGKGTYGISYKCDLKFGQLMVKRLTSEMKLGEEDFKTRIEELGKLGQSPNILPPFGGYFSKFEKFLIYDYVPAGSLHSLLHGTKRYPKPPVVLDWNSTLKISLGVARGINHLHSVKFVHGNIKSSNVLLTKDLDGCISDYGLAPIMKFPTTTSQYLGYHAPEFIKSQEATIKSDVYSFGAMLLEILTGKPPDDVNFPRRVCSKVHEEGASSIFSLELLKYDCEKEMQKMLRIAMQCVLEEPTRRYEMNDVTNMIENMWQKRALLAKANDAKLEGIKLFKDGLYLEALSQYELALQVVPDEMPSASDLRCTCYVNRGKCFLKLGKYEDTITECNKALELNPDYLRAMIKRGEAHEKLQNFAWAIADMETSIWKLDPTDVKSKKTKERLVAEVKRLQNIRKKRALLAKANGAKLKGIKLFKDGLYQEALSQYELALQVVPDEMPSASDLRCTCYVNRGKCFLKLGKYEDTITECNKALELNPDYLRALIKRGEAHEKLQNFAGGAIADMETSICKLDPTDVKSKKTKKRSVAEVERLNSMFMCDRWINTLIYPPKSAFDSLPSYSKSSF